MGRPARGWQVVTEMRVRREALGWSRQQLAQRIDALFPTSRGLTYETVEEWELRQRVPSGAYAHALCTLLGAADIAELGLGHSLAAAACWCWATAGQRKACVQRRGMLQAAVTVGGLALLPAPALVQAAQLFGHRRRVDGLIVDEVEKTATGLAVTYATDPAHADIARAAAAHARTLANLLRAASMTPTVRTRLQAACADACALSGFVALNSGQLGEAGLWFHRTLSLAREAGDARLQAAALVGRSWLDSPTAIGPSGHAPHRAIATLRQACATAAHVPAGLRGWAHAYLARDLAGIGDADGSAWAFDQAFTDLADFDPDDGGFGWLSGHGELSGWQGVRLAGFDAVRMLHLGLLDQALPLAEDVLADTANPIRRARLQGEMTAGWARAGNPEQACAHATAALDEPAYRLAVELVRAARARFDPRWAGLSCVAELDERLASLS